MKTRKVQIIEDFHGTKVADPYRWLEDDRSLEVAEWAETQNEVTRAFLDRHPARSAYLERITELWNYPKYGVPHRLSGYYYFQENDGMQNQAVLYRALDLDGEREVVLDPNGFSDDGTVALTNYSVSQDGGYLAYGTSESGSDWQVIRVLNLKTKELVPDTINWCKFTSLPWAPDGSGFFYSRYPQPGTVPPEDGSRYNKVYFHKLGSPQSEDQLIYERQDRKNWSFSVSITDDNRYLILRIGEGTDPRNRIYYRYLDSGTDFNSGTDFTPLLDNFDARYQLLGNTDDTFYFLTNKDAPRGRIIAIDLNNPHISAWEDLVPEQEEVVADARYVGGHFIVVGMKDAHHHIQIYSAEGDLVDRVGMPTVGTIIEINDKPKQQEFFFAFQSFLYPPTIFHYDLNRRQASIKWRPAINFDTPQYETKQVFYTSKDGTRIPMFLTHKKDLALDGNNPTLLYAYGGFNASRMPEFVVADLAFIERGGVFAMANLRGGSEYGEAWHQAGMLEKKQNVFDDFIAAGEWLIEHGYTCQQKLAIKGRSNGGLLTAACMVQRPGLYGAVISQVPVIDMLRYHKFTVGRFWIPEYGDAESNADHFAFMYAYSPLHNVRVGAVYPPIMIMTAKSDDRVVPAHALKFAATLQDVAVSDNPILLRVEDKAGHGAGKPTHKQIEEYVDLYTFIDKALIN